MHFLLKTGVFFDKICVYRYNWGVHMLYKDMISTRATALYYPDFKEENSSRRWYQHDIDTIIYSDPFRKMQRKSQLLSIYDPVSRSRLIHTFEVVRIAKEISEKLELNTELTEAIALAHDFGNVAYGKCADLFLQAKTSRRFKHEDVSALMLKVCASRPIPDKYRELARKAISKNKNTTHLISISEFPKELEVYQSDNDIHYVCISPEVLDGIRKHGTKLCAHTLEGQVVNYADNIAYLIQDINDFEISGIFNARTKERYGRCLNDLKKVDRNKETPITGVVGKTTSIRTATLIERFVSFNKKQLLKGTLPTIKSPFFSKEIPQLQIDPLLTRAIDLCWEFKKEFYDHELIKISNVTSSCKMEQLWDILNEDSAFTKNNKSYISFMKSLSSPIFESYKKEKKFKDERSWEQWKKAYFIAHLTCDEIDLIIKSFLERDYEFHLALPTFK